MELKHLDTLYFFIFPTKKKINNNNKETKKVYNSCLAGKKVSKGFLSLRSDFIFFFFFKPRKHGFCFNKKLYN